MTKPSLPHMRNEDYELKKHATVCGYRKEHTLSFYGDEFVTSKKYRIYKCKRCGKQPFSKYGFKLHLKIHHNIALTCSIREYE